MSRRSELWLRLRVRALLRDHPELLEERARARALRWIRGLRMARKRRSMNLARRARATTRMSQRAFAELIGVSFVSVARWETGVVVPRGAVRSLLRLIEANPRQAVEALEGDDADAIDPRLR